MKHSDVKLPQQTDKLPGSFYRKVTDEFLNAEHGFDERDRVNDQYWTLSCIALST